MWGVDGTIPAFTWANRPAATGLNQEIIRITDIGASSGGTVMYSNGSSWRPINQHTVLYQLPAPVSITYANDDLNEIKVASVKIPANFAGVGDVLVATVALSKNIGGAGGYYCSYILGSTDDFVFDPYILNSLLTILNYSAGTKHEFEVRANDIRTRGKQHFLPWVSAVASTGAAVAVDWTQDNYFGLYPSIAAIGGSESVTVNAFTLELIKCA